jgi:hypothetical protein
MPLEKQRRSSLPALRHALVPSKELEPLQRSLRALAAVNYFGSILAQDSDSDDSEDVLMLSSNDAEVLSVLQQRATELSVSH